MKAITIDINNFIPVNAAKERIFEPRKRRGKIDIPFLVITLILLAFGLVMLFSASYAYAFYNKGNSFYYIERQLLFAVMGVAYLRSTIRYFKNIRFCFTRALSRF